MTNEELDDLGDAVRLVADRLIEPVEGMHRVISERAFKYVGRPGQLVRMVHDPVVGGVYKAIRRTVGAVASAVGGLVSRSNPVPEPISNSPSASRVQAAVNSVFGDELADRENSLAVALSVRAGGSEVNIDSASLAAAFPNATDHIVVLVHGLGQTEHCWDGSDVAVDPPKASDVPRAPDLPGLALDAGLTPVRVRHNTGLPVARTGDELAMLLSRLAKNWPIANPQLSLVGYSMGGLVARSALAAGVGANEAWVGPTEHIVTVGTPHHGSLIAQLVSAASRVLRGTRTTTPLGGFLDGRSDGIRDLQTGDGVPTGWEDTADVKHHFVAAVVTPDQHRPFGAVIGDLVVQVSSATGRSINTENVHVVGRRRHFDLPTDPEVGNKIIEWLTTPRP
jgi:triacylglycerol esterase/lipase EstA (alpha/beta hydrolase family)